MNFRWGRAVVVWIVAGLGLGGGAAATAEEDPLTAMDGRWHFSGSPYFWASGIKGSVSVKDLPEVPVEASFSDIMKHFDIGLLALNEFRHDRFGLGADLIYLNLGADVPGQPPVVGVLDLGVDQRQLTVEGYGFYRLANEARSEKPAFLDLLVGVRYSGTSARLTSASSDLESSKRTLDWVDAVLGLKGYAGLGRKWGLSGRADIAGFGSDFTWQVAGELTFRPSTGFVLGLGYRYMDVDYDKGTGTDRKLYSIAYKGPQIRLTFIR